VRQFEQNLYSVLSLSRLCESSPNNGASSSLQEK